MTPPDNSRGEFTRLEALIAAQRRELDDLRVRAADRSISDLARGVLMERHGWDAGEAARQLDRLASEAGMTQVELAAELTGERAVSTGRADGQPRPGLVRARIETADDGPSVAAATLEEGLAPLGACAVALWLLEPDGGLELAGEAGFGPREAGRWRRIPPGVPSLPGRVISESTEVWWLAGAPEGEPTPVIGAAVRGARAVLPLRAAAITIGAMTVCWPEPLPEFPAELRHQLSSLAEVCAQALAARPGEQAAGTAYRHAWVLGLLDSLTGSVLFVRPVHDDAGQVADLRIDHLSDGFADPAGRGRGEIIGRRLLEVYPAAAVSGGLYERVLQVLETGEPQASRGEVVAALGLGGTQAQVLDVRVAPLFDGAVIIWRQAGEAEHLRVLLEHAQRLGHLGAWEENLHTGEIRCTDGVCVLFGDQPGTTIPIADLHLRVPQEDVPIVERFRHTLFTEKRRAVAAFRIIRRNDNSVRQMRAFAEPVTGPAGNVIAVRGAFQDVSAQYHTELALAVTRDQLASTEERAAEEHRLALRLQQAITPQAADPVEVTGLDVAARYRPASEGHLVGGDWYDTLVLPNKEVLLVVGDIAGHGLDAVNGMVTMRNCLRGLAITGAGPAALLGWLNSIACHFTASTVGTVVCALYDPETRMLRWARAGHLPPVLVRDGSARQLSQPAGLLFGADADARYEEVGTQLRFGDVLVMFSDGLVERKDAPIDQAIEGLLAATGEPDADVGAYADRLLATSPADTEDDTCLVVVRIR
jgi:serine phosphatase RsbU (regulator of sigma subunit)/PAS domain-containing protein